MKRIKLFAATFVTLLIIHKGFTQSQWTYSNGVESTSSWVQVGSPGITAPGPYTPNLSSTVTPQLFEVQTNVYGYYGAAGLFTMYYPGSTTNYVQTSLATTAWNNYENIPTNTIYGISVINNTYGNNNPLFSVDNNGNGSFLGSLSVSGACNFSSATFLNPSTFSKIGIGTTTTPSTLLDIRGSDQWGLNLCSTNPVPKSQITFSQYSNNTFSYLWAMGANENGSSATKDFYIWNGQTISTPFYISTSNHVGLGLGSSPSTSINTSSSVTVGNNGFTNALAVNGTTNFNGNVFIPTSTLAINQTSVPSLPSNAGTKVTSLQLAVNGNANISNALIVGNVTDFASAKTAFPGNYSIYAENGIITEGVTIALKNDATGNYWADFVFDKNYKLTPLAELESFIKNNHHLPEIPSAKEVSEKGINVAQIDAKLLQKIEELTLYMIEMKKENDKLSKQVESLSYEVKQLQSK